MSQQDVTVTNVRVYTQHGVDRDLTLRPSTGRACSVPTSPLRAHPS